MKQRRWQLGGRRGDNAWGRGLLLGPKEDLEYATGGALLPLG
jgi:hypothetical protein